MSLRPNNQHGPLSGGRSIADGFSGPDFSLELSLPETMPLLRIDSDALEAVLTTLVENARQAGAMRLTITMTADLTTVRFDLIDDGPGIPAGDRDRIFDPFFTSKREQGGTGLGLSIARSLLQAYGGSLDLVSSSQGAHFRIAVGRV